MTVLRHLSRSDAGTYQVVNKGPQDTSTVPNAPQFASASQQMGSFRGRG